MSKKRTNFAILLKQARSLAAEAARSPGEAALVLVRGLVTLWPAPIYAAQLNPGVEAQLAVVDEVGHSRLEWEPILASELLRRLQAGDDPMVEDPLPQELDLPDHFLHVAPVAHGERRFGSLALALHKRSSDAALARALVTFTADHVAFLFFVAERERQGQARWRDLADLANLVAHEFNNVLNSVVLQVAALSHKGLKPDQYPELGEVRRQVSRAGAEAHQMQDLCIKGLGPVRAVDLNTAVRAAAAGLGKPAQFDLALDLPLVAGNALDLERLAGALLRQAAAVLPVGQGDIFVQTTGGAGKSPCLWVEDTGPDPDQDLLAHLFEPFAAVRPGADVLDLTLARAIGRRLGVTLRGERREGGGLRIVAEFRPAGKDEEG